MKKFRITLLILLFTLIQVIPMFVYADPTPSPSSEYKLLAPLDTGTGETMASTDIVSYLKAMYMFFVSFSVVLAIFMIVLGGFQWMSTDAISDHKEGKEKIKNAVIGLVLVLTTWLILYTINPRFVEIKFFQ